MRLIEAPLKESCVRGLKINWEPLDMTFREYKPKLELWDQLNHIGHLLKFFEDPSFAEILKRVQSLVNLSSSYLIPLLINEKKEPELTQIIDSELCLDLPSKEFICIEEREIINNEDGISPLCSNILFEECNGNTLEILKMISIESTIISKMTSE